MTPSPPGGSESKLCGGLRRSDAQLESAECYPLLQSKLRFEFSQGRMSVWGLFKLQTNSTQHMTPSPLGGSESKLWGGLCRSEIQLESAERYPRLQSRLRFDFSQGRMAIWALRNIPTDHH